MERFFKYTEGTVRQTFNEKGALIEQQFVAGDCVCWTDSDDCPIDCPGTFYAPFDMEILILEPPEKTLKKGGSE